MKKFNMKNLYVVLILVLSLALSACSDSDDKEKNQVVDDVTTTNLDVESGSGEITKDDVTTDGDETSGSDETTKNGETETSTEEITTTEGDTTTETSVEQTTTSEEQEECAHSFGDWKVTKEATCSKEGTKQRACTKCSHTETVGVPTIAHTEVKDAAVEATCTEAGKTEGKHCSVCNKIIVKQETIKANGHKEVTVSGKVPTESESGLTDGKKCSKCGVITVAQITIAPYIESCNDDYGYKDLAKQSKGTAKQSMYTRMDELAKQFHTSKTMNAKDNIAFSVAFADLGLTVDEAVQVWITYKNDHPLYYWMSVSINYDDSNIYVLTDNEYASASARASLNTLVYKKIAEYSALAASETSEYMISLAYHDAIIEAIDYAYEKDGTTPEDAAWAHNILGVFEKGSGVCESYARTYQLLLNVRGIENVFVIGVGGDAMSGYENHAWNLVKMDDDNWYWCDLTWDDAPNWEWGIKYNNFCVNDIQNVNWEDSANDVEAKNFMSQHKPGKAIDSAPMHNITLPARSNVKFSSKGIQLVRDTFKTDEVKYSVSGYNTVQLISANKSGVYKIPETVKYNGRTYTVISIGGIFESTGGYGDGYCFNQGQDMIISKLIIPKTIKFIWDSALAGNIAAIEADSANPYFKSVDGVLFTKSLYTLIQYPYAKAKVDKYVIPEATRDIAIGAFSGVYYGFNELVISKNVDGIGQANWGIGYHNEKPTGFFGGNYVSGELSRLQENLISKNITFTISIDEQNVKYKIINGVLYSVWNDEFTGKYSAMAELLIDLERTEVVLEDYLVRIDSGAFATPNKLVNVTLPKGTENLFDYAFMANDKLKIIYNGTVSEWNKIYKNEFWDHPDINVKTPVQCTDGIGY